MISFFQQLLRALGLVALFFTLITPPLHSTAQTSLTPSIYHPTTWEDLQAYQETITREEFEELLIELFDPFGGMERYIEVDDQGVTFFVSDEDVPTPAFYLQFAEDPASRKTVPYSFRSPQQIRQLVQPHDKPLQGLRVALDPGHIGGSWARIENRSVRYQGKGPVQEGDHTLLVAQVLRQKLQALGATVYLVRENHEPVTPYRPQDFLDEARGLIYEHYPSFKKRWGSLPPQEQNKKLGSRLQQVAELMFYRGSDIEERGRKIAREFQPDISISLHFNATKKSGRGRLTPTNRHIFFIHGSYTADETKLPTQRYRMISKMLQRVTPIEKEVAKNIAFAFQQLTGVQPVMYGNSATTREIEPGYKHVVARNLAANRLYPGPVVFTEPWFMNHPVTYRRLLAGDYQSTRLFLGKPYRSIYQEYADAIAQGLILSYTPEGTILPSTPPSPPPIDTMLSPHPFP